MTATTKPVNLLDLPIGDIERIEQEVGVQMVNWPKGVPSLAGLYGRIYAAGTGQQYDDVKGMSIRELTDLVTLDDPEVPEGEVPTPGDA